MPARGSVSADLSDSGSSAPWLCREFPEGTADHNRGQRWFPCAVVFSRQILRESFSQQIPARVTRIRRIFAKNPDSWVIHASGVARLRTRGPWVEIGLNRFSSKHPSLSSARRSLLQQRGVYGQTENEWL